MLEFIQSWASVIPCMQPSAYAAGAKSAYADRLHCKRTSCQLVAMSACMDTVAFIFCVPRQVHQAVPVRSIEAFQLIYYGHNAKMLCC